ncbi:uncharacterized protein TNCV_2579771 [Trichonephila clavipes]|uniref:Mutator-like transposase domain-containing protein n=1 Tax=Trichonephila clavipes TaxID=2585209 RepID=A0A8X6SAU4_TRICX|nr:uncharacterized protein TNCV_2579771 [Trichonephila clavipes]
MLDDIPADDQSSVNIVIDLNIISGLLKSMARCKYCNKCDSLIIFEDARSRRGLCVSLTLHCTFSGQAFTSMSSNSTNGIYDINVRLAYGLRCIESLSKFSDASMKKAVEETVEMNNSNRDITAAFDGSWQIRGHISLNGVVSATSLETGFSGGMESAGILKKFQRSEILRNVKYANYLGDGDSKAFNTVSERKVYRNDFEVKKLECIANVLKRMGSRLRALRNSMKSRKLSDGKGISGRGRLTDNEISKLQQYCGLAIRRNMHSVSDMFKAVWAIYFSKLSTDSAPQYGLCPTSPDTWC